MENLTSTEYINQTNSWNTYIRYAKKANDQFINSSMKEKYSKLANNSYAAYIHAGGRKAKSSLFPV